MSCRSRHVLECTHMAEATEPTAEDVLASATLFEGLPDSALSAIAPNFRAHRYAPKAVLWLEGDRATEFHLVGSGKVKVVQTSLEGEDVILHVAEPGDFIGALPTPIGNTYPAGAVALEEAVTFAVNEKAFERILHDYPQVALRLLRFATKQLQVAHRRLREMSTERVERRIARTLTRLASQLGHKQGSAIEIEAPLSRQDLAELSGTTIYTVSRILKNWQRQGLVSARRKQIVILDPHGLVTIAEDLPSNPASA